MTDEVKRKKSVRSNIPRKEADLITVALAIAETWAKHPELTLTWITPEQMKQTTTSFATSFSVRSDVKGIRAETTHSLKSINVEIDKSIAQLKGYIAELFSKKDALAHYAKFGIEKIQDTYKLPLDGDRRLFALEQLLKGIEQHQLTDRKYGTAYWEEIIERFTQAKNAAAENDSLSAQHVSNKSEQKVVLEQALNSLILLIRANYPHTWKEELRVWGFQKEKY